MSAARAGSSWPRSRAIVTSASTSSATAATRSRSSGVTVASAQSGAGSALEVHHMRRSTPLPPKRSTGRSSSCRVRVRLERSESHIGFASSVASKLRPTPPPVVTASGSSARETVTGSPVACIERSEHELARIWVVAGQLGGLPRRRRRWGGRGRARDRAGSRVGAGQQRAQCERARDGQDDREQGGAEQHPALSCHGVSVLRASSARSAQNITWLSLRPNQATSAVASSSRSFADHAWPPLSPWRIWVKLNRSAE